MPTDLDKIYILVSKEFEPDRYVYLQKAVETSLAKYVSQGKVIFYEPVFKNRDEDKFKPYNFKHDLRVGEKAITVSYLNMFKEILDAGYKTVLTLESDVIFSKNFAEKLDEVVNEWLQISSEPSMVFIGSGCNLKPKTPLISKNLHLENRNKCADSMIMKREAVERIYNYVSGLELIDLPIDLLFDRIWGYSADKPTHLNAYWIHNPIIVQGSQCGVYRSTIR